ncbi:MAG TPA: VWA domain-containing protein [Bryobacteraceae bacterium]|jgi:hypothetical protein|nr:VWA domain-containing protein [Bryobacteraceae bacterium]
MFFLNLTGPEFFTLLGTLGALVSALYLLDRARGRKVVSTLQFWVAAGAIDQRKPRRRVSDPWSLALQLASLLLLLLAIAGMEWGSGGGRGRDSVLLIDTSSWSAARVAGDSNERVLAREEQQALGYLSALGRNDRVMLVSAGALAEPLTRFTADREELRRALERIQPGYGALNPDAALSFATQARNLAQSKTGEIVYTGPARIERDSRIPAKPDRVLPVTVDPENCGILRFTAEPLANEPGSWQATVELKNYGARTRRLQLNMQFEQTAFVPRRIVLAAGAETTADYIFSTQSPGVLRASLNASDSLALDNRASLSLPTNNALRIAVYTPRPDVLRPLFTSDSRLRAEFFPPSGYDPHRAADLAIFDGFSPASDSRIPAIWINPPKEHAPLPVKSSAEEVAVRFGGSDAKPQRTATANIFETFEGDDVLASSPEGPVVVVRAPRQNRPAAGVVGFDPLAGNMRFDVGTPMLLASLIDRLQPGSFRERFYSAEPVGLARVALAGGEQKAKLSVVDLRGAPIPFTRRNAELQLYVSRPDTVRIVSGERERVLDLGLPAVADGRWDLNGAKEGVPTPSTLTPTARDLWKWLAWAAALLLASEWYLFGGAGRIRLGKRPVVREEFGRERELVAK